jgi:signal transduction histidine kinase
MAAFLFRRSMATQAQFVQDQLQLARVQEKLTSEQQRVAEQRQFLDMLAHELKTPLGVIQLTLDSVQLPMAQQRRLHRSLDTMSAVIDRCRLSLQLDEGRLTPKLEAVEISAAVHDLVLACKDPDRVTFTGEGPSLVHTDRQLFLVILHNLLDNAAKYSPADSMVTVSTHVCDEAGEGRGDGMCVIVHNRLTRRPAATPETLFEKYFRGINATGQTGSGLGLHLSRRLATIINGHLWAELGSDDIKLCLWIPN